MLVKMVTESKDILTASLQRDSIMLLIKYLLDIY